MPAKIMNMIVTICRLSATVSAFSWATCAPVTASAVSGTAASSRVASSLSVTPSAARTLIASKVSGEPSTFWAVAVSKYAEVVPPRFFSPPNSTVPTTVNSWVGPRNRMLMSEPSGMSCFSAEVASMTTSCGPRGCVTAGHGDVAAQGDVAGHAVALGGGAAAGQHGLALGVGQQGVAGDAALGDADAVDGLDLVEHRRGDRRAAEAGTFGLLVRSLGADDGVGAGAELAEQLREGERHGVGEDESAGEERDAERDGGGGQDEAHLVRDHPPQGRCEHGGQAPRRFM